MNFKKLVKAILYTFFVMVVIMIFTGIFISAYKMSTVLGYCYLTLVSIVLVRIFYNDE